MKLGSAESILTKMAIKNHHERTLFHHGRTFALHFYGLSQKSIIFSQNELIMAFFNIKMIPLRDFQWYLGAYL